MIDYLKEYIGETASLITALLWTITVLAFESASLKIGSLSVNIIRLFIGLFFISVFSWFYRGNLLPVDAGAHQWIWLSVSGLIGFVFGDLFLFRSFTLIGSRFAMLIMTLVPPLTTIFGRIFLQESLLPVQFLGMFLTVSGIILAIFNKEKGNNKFKLKLSARGMFFAFCGALGQAAGLVVSKYGMKDYDPVSATQIRIIAGTVGFSILIIIAGRSIQIIKALTNKSAMIRVITGAFFGLFMGVSLSQYAIKYTETGIASTIMAMVPIFIIPPTILLYKQKVTLWETIGAVISVGGITLLFIK